VKIVVLGTGGTIAGEGHDPHNALAYTAGQRPVSVLLQGVTLPPGAEVLTEQVAQLDSKDMDHATWQTLLARCRHWLAQDVAGIVITHGTDTLEETAFFLSQTLPADKPVVLTCAMRPATHPQPDGPANLTDALSLVTQPQARGVMVVCAGLAHGAGEVQKVHASRLDAFASASGPWAVRAQDVWHWASNLPLGQVDIDEDAIEKRATACLQTAVWPRVEVVLSHAGATGAVLQAMLQASTPGDHDSDARLGQPLAGLVVAATGHVTIHAALEAALRHALRCGVPVMVTTRCVWSGVTTSPHWLLANTKFESNMDASTEAQLTGLQVSPLSPVKARIDFMLQLMLNAGKV